MGCGRRASVVSFSREYCASCYDQRRALVARGAKARRPD
jgi:hypothetical protein